ncbi:MAG: hypothetical protein IJI10_08180 [Eubacterium sp.]|nr:hypothetical protein [Eubacterium sp.]MBR0398234.1 hypothetical protein [Eubacterium sp.]
MQKVAPAVRKETKRVILITVIGVIIMFAVFAGLHFAMPDKVPFDYRVILGGLGGGCIAVLNFFMMGLTVQKVTSMEDEGLARQQMKSSYTYRMLLQILWMVAAIAAPCFQFVAGLVPLLFPSLGLKLLSVMGKIS